MYSKNRNYILLAVLILGLGIRLLSINYGLPYVVGPDETRQVLDAFSMAARSSLMPGDYSYAALHKYLLLFAYGIYFIFGKMTGLFPDKLQFAFKFISEPYSFYLLGRMLSVILGTIIIWITYKIGEKTFKPAVGIIAAVFAALNFHLVQLSYWAVADILLIIFSAAAFFFIFQLIKQPGFGRVIAASLAVGLAISSKFQGVMLIVPLAMVLLLAFPRGPKLLKIISASIAAVFLTSLVGNAQYLMRFKEASVKFAEIFRASQFGISSAPVFNHNILDSSIWYFRELMRQDGLMGLMFCLGIIYALVKFRAKENLVFTAFLFTFLLFFSRASLRYVYYGALILPVSCIFAAKFLHDIYYLRLRFVKLCVVLLTATVILSSLSDDLYAAYKRSHLDTRQEAKSWIESNIPAGAKIAVDWYELNAPLESDIPFMIRTGKAINFYADYVPESVRKRFSDFVLQNKKYYNLIQVIYEKKKGFWPVDMPAKLVERGDKFDYARTLYSRFNFLTLDELKAKGAQYLIISSYCYAHFLLDNDVNKTELYNPYIKENTLVNNRQAGQYEPTTKEGILFFLAKRARDFYAPILSSQDKNIAFLKEFRPGRFNLGPVIKIYRLGKSGD